MHRTHRPVAVSMPPLFPFHRETHPLQLIRLRHALRRNHAIPLLAPVLWMNIQNLRRDKTRRDAVDPTEVHPFDREAFSQLHDGCFGGVVLSLLAYPLSC